jgi:outer membrane immunogenic protein
MSSLVIGVEGDYSLVSGGNSGTGNGVDGVQTNVTNFGTARARVGYAIDRSLLFVTGGFAWGNVSSHGWDYYLNDPSYYASSSKTQSGWVLGAGYEYAITNNVSVKMEALYADLGKESGTDLEDYTQTFHTTVAIARAGINLKF